MQNLNSVDAFDPKGFGTDKWVTNRTPELHILVMPTHTRDANVSTFGIYAFPN